MTSEAPLLINEDSSFSKLLRNCLNRGVAPSQFCKLVKTLRDSSNAKDEKVDVTPLFVDSEKRKLQRSYIFEFLVAGDVQNTCDEIINYFSTVSRLIPIKDQISILLFINQNPDQFPWDSYIKNASLLTSIIEYAKHFMGLHEQPAPEQNQLDVLSFHLTKIFKHIFTHAKATKLKPEYLAFITEFGEWLKLKSYHESSTLLHALVRDYNSYAIRIGINDNEKEKEKEKDIASGTNNSQLKSVMKEKDTAKFLTMKKIIWLSQKVTIEFTTFDDQFIQDFKGLINLSHISTAESISTVTMELISGLFQCLNLSNSEEQPIWKEYIVFKLPWLLKTVLKINQTKMEKCLETMSSSEPIVTGMDESIFSEFHKSLAELELVKPGSIKMLPHVNDSASDATILLDDLENQYSNKFLQCNPEFTSIEEIGIVEFLNNINKSIKLKHKFCELYIRSMNSFILTGDTLRLRRLLISASINLELLDTIVLFDSPINLLKPLLKFLESQVLRKPSDNQSSTTNNNEKFLNQTNSNDILMDLDLGNDDPSNAQDFFSDVSTVLVFSKFIITRYSIILKHDELSLVPNTLSLLCNSNLTAGNTEEMKEIDLDDAIINKWISSMFDSSNVDGISDALIKMSTPLEYTKLLPRIINEAIICRKIGWLENDALLGGLEYLHQKFLVGWLIHIIFECCHLKWLNDSEASNLDDILDDVLTQLLTINSNESIEISTTLKLIKYVVNDPVYEAFPKLRNILKEPTKRNSLNEICSNLVKFVTAKDKNSNKPEFGLSELWQNLYDDNMAVYYFYEELLRLTKESHMVADMSYDLISLLLITFAKWMVGDGISDTWPLGLSEIKQSGDSSANLIEYRKKCSKLVFNRQPEHLSIKGLPESETKQTENPSKVSADESNMDSGFFGFLQDPHSDNELSTDIKDEKADEIDIDDASVVPKIDVYGASLYFLVFENRNNPIVDRFQRRIIHHLS